MCPSTEVDVKKKSLRRRRTMSTKIGAEEEDTDSEEEDEKKKEEEEKKEKEELTKEFNFMSVLRMNKPETCYIIRKYTFRVHVFFV